VVCRNPALAEECARKRPELVVATEAELPRSPRLSSAAAERYAASRPLHGA